MIYFNENEHEKYEHGTQQLKKIKQMCRRWAHLRISFWHLLLHFFKKIKKNMEIFYTCLPKILMI